MMRVLSKALPIVATLILLFAVSCAGPMTSRPSAEAPSVGGVGGVSVDRTVFSPSFTTYEAESGSFSGSLVGPDRTYHTVASESSGRQYVSLSTTGNSLQWTTTAAANGLNIRYNMPDSTSGGGTTGTLSLYVNGTKVQTLNLSSHYAWVYGAYPYSDGPSGGGPLHFYDDTHFLLGTTIAAGSTIKLQKDAGDTAAYYNIDFIDLESVPAPLTQPTGSVSITSFGAVAGSGTDISAALNSAVVAAGSGGTVWIPSGIFTLTTRPAAFPTNVTIRGAGMWYSVLSGVGSSFTPNAKTIQFYDFAISGNTTHRVDSALEGGIDGGGNGFGPGSVVQNVWFNHLKVGIWTGPMTPSLTVNNCRVWDTFADGINFYNGTTNSQILNTSVRNTGDDGIAIWSGGGNACNNNTVNGNLVQFPTHANNIAVYGGSGNTIQDNKVADTIQYGSGIYIAARFGEVAFSGTTTVTGNTVTRAGSFDPDYGFGDGGIRLEANDNNVAGTFIISNNTVDTPTYAGVLFVGSGTITGDTFTNLLVSNPGTTGLETRGNARGSATFTGSTYGTSNNAAGANFVITGASVAGATGSGGGTTNTPVGPAGYTYVANENGSYTLSSPGDVAFGVNGAFNYKYAVSGSVTFNTTTFGDPAPGVAKYGFYKAGPTGPAGFTYCAPENASFALPFVSDVAFGANGSFNYQYGKTGTITFNTATFGDPAVGTAKAGFYRAALPDLILTSLTWSPTTVAGGNAVAFTATVKNQGGGATAGGIKKGIAFYVDGTEVTWSDNYLTSIPAGGTVTLTANGGTAGATWAATAGTHTISATVDDTSLIAETNEGNNSTSSSMTVGAGTLPDLVITSLTWSPTSPAVGNGVAFTATIKNQGTGPTPSGVKHGIAFYVDGTEVTWSDTYFTSMAAGASVTLTANGGTAGATWAATSGTHTISATVDDQNLIAESNETNNSSSTSLTVGGSSQPDVIVTNITWNPATPANGNAVTFSVTVKNQGTGPTPAGVKCGVAFYVDGAQGPWCDNFNSSIAAGATVTLTANGGPSGATWTAVSGTHAIKATVDDQNLIVESNETNNNFTKNVVVN